MPAALRRTVLRVTGTAVDVAVDDEGMAVARLDVVPETAPTSCP